MEGDIRGDMMRKWIGRICALLVIVLLVSVAMSSAACPTTPPEKEVKLWAGQTYLAAYIDLTYESNGDLTVEFEMQGDWKIYEAHIQVETSWVNVPHTKNWKLKPGQFEVQAYWPSGSSGPTVTVDDELVPNSGVLIIVIHAVVKRPIPCEEVSIECVPVCYQEETGWANECSDMNYVKDLFEVKGGWATYVEWDP